MKNMQVILNVEKLSGMDLDYWVAKAQGHEIIGKALAYYDPECGSPSVSSDQVPHTGIMATHERYFYIIECGCELCEQMYLEMKAEYPDMQPEPKVLGHDWRCLTPVVDFSTDHFYMAHIMEEEKIGVLPEADKWVAITQSKVEENQKIKVVGNTIPEAVMRAFVISKLGSTITYKK
jgi:hypothetical protein